MTSKHWCTPCCLCVVYTTPLVYTICVESHVTLSAKSAKHCVSRHRFYSARHFSTNGSGCLNQSSVCVVSYTTPRTRFCKWQLCCVSALHHLHQLPRGKQQMLQGERSEGVCGWGVGSWCTPAAAAAVLQYAVKSTASRALQLLRTTWIRREYLPSPAKRCRFYMRMG